MKKWICTICGYIHEGPEPPEECPVCGADKSQFELMEEKPAEPATVAAHDERPALKWRCRICGYIHEGPEPPDVCPVCGADKSEFERVEDEKPDDTETQEPSTGSLGMDASPPPSAGPSLGGWRGAWQKISDSRLWYGAVADLAIRHHVHPISVHIPNGTLPIAVVFLLLAAAFDAPSVGLAAFYNMVFIFLSMPVVAVSGILFWKRRYGGRLNPLFKTKLVCAGIVLFGSLVSVVWHLAGAGVSADPTFGYVFLHLVVLVAAVVAGYMGGRLVFHKKGS